jgi:hypothetical protein
MLFVRGGHFVQVRQQVVGVWLFRVATGAQILAAGVVAFVHDDALEREGFEKFGVGAMEGRA